MPLGIRKCRRRRSGELRRVATRPSRSPLAIQRRQGSGQSSTTEAELDPSPVSEDAGPRDDEVAFPFDRYRTAPLVALCDTLAVATLQVDSNRYGWSLVIDQTPRSDYYRAELRCGSTQAGVEFYYGKEVPPVGDFFKELAESWGGWEGERAWGSLDGEVERSPATTSLGRSHSPSGFEATCTRRPFESSSGPRQHCCSLTPDDWIQLHARLLGSIRSRIAAALIGGCRVIRLRPGG